MERKILKGLKVEMYEHTWDIKAKKFIKGISVFETAVKKYNESLADKFTVMEHKASYLEIKYRQYPRIYDIFTDCCRILDIEIPPLFLMRSAEINAYTIGISTPLVCLTSGCIQFLTEDELRFIIGHELGHIKSEHLLYSSIARWLEKGGEKVFIGAGGILGLGSYVALEAAFYKWHRMSEYTADRAGLLCVQDINVAVSALAKLAGFISGTDDVFNTSEFIQQAKAFNKEYKDGFNKWLNNSKLLLGSVTHPYTVSRVGEISEWYDNGDYDLIVYGEKRPKLTSSEVIEKTNLKKCKKCGCDNIPINIYVCPQCNELL